MIPTFDEMVKMLVAYHRCLTRCWGYSEDFAAIETDAEMNAIMRRGLRREVASVMLPTQHDAQVAEGHS